MKARRTHIKSKTGCLTCRQRRVRCDENRPECINCTRRGSRCDFLYETPTNRPPSLSRSASHESAPGKGSVPTLVAIVDNENVIGTLESAMLRFPPTQSPDWSIQERYFFYHCTQFSERLENSNTYRLNWGTTLLPEFRKIGESVDYVRYGVCGVACAHLALLTKSSTLLLTGYKYRDLALRGLRESLSSFSIDTMDAMLAASLLLSWQAPASQEFSHTLRGVGLALAEMDHRQYSSKLRSLWSLPLSADKSAELSAEPSASQAFCPATVSLDLACSALQELRKQMGDDAELVRGAKELYNYVQNLRISPPGQSPTEQLAAIYPIRWFLQWIPHAIFRLSKLDPQVLVFGAHYQMVTIAIEPFLPAACGPFAISKRVEYIERVAETLAHADAEPQGSSNDWGRKQKERLRVLMLAPLAFARDYRQTHYMPDVVA